MTKVMGILGVSDRPSDPVHLAVPGMSASDMHEEVRLP